METLTIELEIEIKASPERIFAALTKSPALWWNKKYLESKEAHDLILEPKIGGRFYERWGESVVGDRQGVLLGKVVAIKPPELITLSGPFGLSNRAVFNIVSISLKGNENLSTLYFSHHATGDVDQSMLVKYSHEWQDLLDRLKSMVEMHVSGGFRQDPYLETS